MPPPPPAAVPVPPPPSSPERVRCLACDGRSTKHNCGRSFAIKAAAMSAPSGMAARPVCGACGEEKLASASSQQQLSQQPARRCTACVRDSACSSVAAESEGLRLHLSSSNSTGYKGVQEQASGRFRALHYVRRREAHLGIFDTALEAAVDEMNGLVRDFGGPWISEVYSLPRVTHELGRQRLPSGTALDLTTGDEEGRPCDFSVKERREEARRRIERGNPWLLIGSPMCKAFSRLLNILKEKRGEETIRRAMVEAMVHLECCIQLYRDQMAG